MAALIKNKKTKQGREPRRSPGRSPLTTYYRAENGGPAASPFVKKQPKKSSRKYLFGFADIILVILLLLGVIYSLGLNSKPRVIASTYAYNSKSAYQTAATAQLKQLKNRNKVTFDEQALVSSLQNRFPEISSVDVELPFFSETPTLRLAIASPAFELRSGPAAYVIDSDGVAVARSSLLPAIKGLANVEDQSGFNINSGARVLSSQSASFISDLIRQCRLSKIPVASLSLPAKPEELYLRTSDQPYFVKFYLGGNVQEETGRFLAARSHFIQTRQTPSQYLDVRVSGKVFYK